MPTADIDYSAARDIIHGPQPSPEVISTPFGLSILEIQGELMIPDLAPHRDLAAYGEGFITVDEIYLAVRCGKLEFTENSSSVTLYVGNSQRLLGSVVDLATPLAVLKIPTNHQQPNDDPIKMIDIIKKKLIFKQRPLPIM